MRGRRGSETGDITASVFVILFVIVAAAVFIFLSLGISLVKKPSNDISASKILPQELSSLNTDFNVLGKEMKLSVFDILVLRSEKKIEGREVENFMKNLYEKEGKCWYICYWPDGEKKPECYKNEEFDRGRKITPTDEMKTILINGKGVGVRFHYDVC